LTLSASDGIGTLARNPAAGIRDPDINTTESVMGGPPLPSIRTAPMIARNLLLDLSSTLHPLNELMRRKKAES